MSHPKDTGKDSPGISAYAPGGVPWHGGFRGSKIKSPGNVINCPETNKKKLLIHPIPGEGGGFPGELGGGAKFQKSGKFHELPRKSINCCLPQVGGGG